LSSKQVEEEMNEVTKYLRQFATASAKSIDQEHEYSDSEASSEDVPNEDAGFLPDCDCGYKYAEGQRFCRKCGKERQKAESCSKCGTAIDSADTACGKCGTKPKREDTEMDLCNDCGHPYMDKKDRFCRKCQAPRPISDQQCECGSLFASKDQMFCNGCGMPRFDAKKEEANQAKHKNNKEEFESRQAERRERSRQSLLKADAERHEAEDRQKKEMAVLKVEEIKQAKRLAPGELMRAITSGNGEVAMAAILHPAFTEAHTRDSRGCTTLHCAAEKGLSTVCRSLLMLPNFRDAAVKDNEGWTALHRAAKNGHSLAAKCLASHPALNSTESSVGRDGFTPLHCAALHGFTATVRTLLDHPRFTGTNAADNWGRTALHIAAEHGHHEVVQTIMEHQRFTNESARTKWGSNAKDVAKGKAKDVMEGRSFGEDENDAFGRFSFSQGRNSKLNMASLADLASIL